MKWKIFSGICGKHGDKCCWGEIDDEHHPGISSSELDHRDSLENAKNEAVELAGAREVRLQELADEASCIFQAMYDENEMEKE